MKSQAKNLLKPLLTSLPHSVLAILLRQLPSLVQFLPHDLHFVWTYYLGDVSVLVNTSNSIEAPMLSGTYDVKLSRAIRHFVKPGSYCIDVGANVGPVTLLLAKLVGSTGHVLAVEPGPPYYQRLNDNLRLNQELKKRVTPINIGLADAKGVLFWEPDPEYPYNAGLFEDRLSNVGVPVSVDTLDAIVEHCGWRRLDFIKIDVEGMELEVFKGGLKTLTQFQPVILFETLEIFRKERGFDPFPEIDLLLKMLDYQFYEFSPEGAFIEVSLADPPPNTLAIPCNRSTSVGVQEA